MPTSQEQLLEQLSANEIRDCQEPLIGNEEEQQRRETSFAFQEEQQSRCSVEVQYSQTQTGVFALIICSLVKDL